MNHHLNNRFTLSSDKYNWILKDKINGKKIKRSYFSNTKQLASFIGELIAKESLGNGEVELGDIHSITPSYSSVIEQSALKLEQYIKSIVREGGQS